MRCALLCLVVACGGTQIRDNKAADLAKLGPATLEATKPKEGDPRTAKVRIWADAGMRAVPQWKEEITEQLDYAGQLLTPLVGVQFKVEAIKDWDRTGDPSEALRALAEVDAGKDVAWVIGYVTPGDKASKAMAELGNGELLGKHVIVRGWAEKAETEALASSLPDLTDAERSEVLSAHKRHKQTVVLLHMLGRTLGAIGETDPTWIQHPTYSPKQAGLSDKNRELLQRSIDGRISDDANKEIAHDLLEMIEKEEWGGWIAGDRNQVTTTLRSVVIAGKSGEAAPDVPMAAVEQFDRIKAMAKSGDLANALAELDNMLTAYPGNATMYLLKCELLIAKPGLKDKTTRAACARVSELAPGDPRPHFVVGEAFARAGDAGAAHAELAQAAGKIEHLETGQTESWQRLIAIYQAMGALTWTEEVIAAAKLDNNPVAAQIASTRARYGVPRGARFVKPEGEAALVSAVQAALNLVYANKYGEADKAIAAGEKKWPGAAGFAAVRCDLALRQAQLAPARAACSRALAADPNASWALYLSGVIALKDTNASGTKTGIEKLKQAIAVDPELGQAWRTLAKAYKRAKDTAALEQLRKDYAAKFGTPLPQ